MYIFVQIVEFYLSSSNSQWLLFLKVIEKQIRRIKGGDMNVSQPPKAVLAAFPGSAAAVAAAAAAENPDAYKDADANVAAAAAAAEGTYFACNSVQYGSGCMLVWTLAFPGSCFFACLF